MESEVESTILTVDVTGDGEPRSAGGWTAAEVYRTQGFFKPGPGKIDTKGLLGDWRNLATDLSAKRNPDGTIAAEWKLSIDLHVRKWRFERSDAIYLLIRRGGTLVHSAVLSGFASQCTNGWKTFTYTGTMPGEVIFGENEILLDSRGEQTLVRC